MKTIGWLLCTVIYVTGCTSEPTAHNLDDQGVINLREPEPDVLYDTTESDVNLEDITRDFTYLLDSLEVPGAQLAILRNEKLVYLRSFGVADFQGNPVVNQSLFRIAEISQALTLMALSRLIHSKNLDPEALVFGEGGLLNDTFGTEYLDSRVNQITVNHLIYHQSGFTDYPNNILLDPPDRSTEELILEVLQERTLAFEPGTDFSQSNFGYLLLGRILSQVSGVPYEQFVFEQLLAPMDITGMQLSGDGFGQKAAGEVSYFTTWELAFPLNVTRMEAGAGWLGSAYHLALIAAQSDLGTSFPDLLQPGQGLADLEDGIWSIKGVLPGSLALIRVSPALSYVALLNRSEEDFEDTFEIITAFMSAKTLYRAQWPQVNYFKQL